MCTQHAHTHTPYDIVRAQWRASSYALAAFLLVFRWQNRFNWPCTSAHTPIDTIATRARGYIVALLRCTVVAICFIYYMYCNMSFSLTRLRSVLRCSCLFGAINTRRTKVLCTYGRRIRGGCSIWCIQRFRRSCASISGTQDRTTI